MTSYNSRLFRHACLLLTALSIIAIGCRREPLEERILQRWIENQPRDLFQREDLHERLPVFEWDIATSKRDGEWTVGKNSDLARSPDGAVLRWEGRFGMLERLVDFSAATVDEIELSIGQFEGGKVTLSWSSDGGPPPRGNRLTTDYHAAATDGSALRFRLSDQPEWSGHIGLLRFRFMPSAQNEIVVKRARGIAWKSTDESLLQVLGRPWRVALNGEVRSAFPAVPGTGVERFVDVPSNSILRFAYNLSREGGGASTAIRVSASGEDFETRVLFDSGSETGLTVTRDTWIDAEVDLSSLAGRTVTLRIEAKDNYRGNPETDLVFLAEPRITRPTTDRLPMNFVIILVDTLRADHLSLYGYERPTSPNLDSWAEKHGAIFENVAAPAPWTLPSHVSMFTGLEAFRHGINHPGVVPDSLELLAEALQRAGYATSAVTGGGFLDPAYHLDQGFESYHYWQQRSDSDLELSTSVDTALAWLKRNRVRPFLLFFHTYEVHTPYKKREPFFETFSDHLSDRRIKISKRPPNPAEGLVGRAELASEPDDGDATAEELSTLVTDLYDSAIAFTDSHVSRLLTGLDSMGLSDRTAVVFTSDHGEMLGEHGMAEHHYLFEENLLVPLVIALPNSSSSGLRVPSQVRLIDLFPTVLELAGLPSPPGIDGKSLLPFLEGEPALPSRWAWSYASRANRGISLRLDNQLKYIFYNNVWAPVRGRQELYRLRTDPNENHDVSADDQETTTRMRTIVAKTLGETVPGLRVRFANSSDNPFSGIIEGPLVTSNRIKSTDLSCDCVVWLAPEKAGFVVPAGQAFTLLFEQPEAAYLRFLLDPFEGNTQETGVTIDIADILDTRVIQSAGSEWTVTELDGGSADTGISIWWEGKPSVGKPAESIIDADLRARLSALGYIN